MPVAASIGATANLGLEAPRWDYLELFLGPKTTDSPGEMCFLAAFLQLLVGNVAPLDSDQFQMGGTSKKRCAFRFVGKNAAGEPQTKKKNEINGDCLGFQWQEPLLGCQHVWSHKSFFLNPKTKDKPNQTLSRFLSISMGVCPFYTF